MNSIPHSHPDRTENSGCSGAFAILNVTRGSRTWKQAVPIRSSAHKSALPMKQKASLNVKQGYKVSRASLCSDRGVFSQQEVAAKPRRWKKPPGPVCRGSRDCARRLLVTTGLAVGLFCTLIALRVGSMLTRRSLEGSLKLAVAFAGGIRLPLAFLSEANL